MRHERFAVVLADVTVRVEAGFAPEITGELAAMIVLDHDDILALRENALISAACSGTIHLICELIGHDSFFAGQFFHRFENHALG